VGETLASRLEGAGEADRPRPDDEEVEGSGRRFHDGRIREASVDFDAMKVMRRVAAVAAFLPLLGCSAAPAGSAGAPSTAPKKAIVLVETKGAPPEVERFVLRFLSAASDRGLGAIVDARLSGAHLADVAVPGEAGAEFRKTWPGDVYLGIVIAPCVIQRHEGHPYNRQANPGTPVGVGDIVVSYEADCSVSLSIVTAPGAAARTIDVTGRNGTTEVSAADTEAEAQAAEDAAERAAKKLASSLR